MNQIDRGPGKQDWIALAITLGLGLIFGIAWIGLIAAWDHHDEPNHFQYLRRLVDLKASPEPGDDDFRLNRQILKSMIWNGFFERAGFEVELPSPKAPVYLPGYTQFTEPPAYYWLAGGVVSLLKNENITRQMYGARLVSLLLYLATIVAGWGMVVDLTSRGNPLRWMVPVSLALLPGLVDIMTAVNNDAGSVAVVSFFLWVCVRLIRYGFRWVEFLLSIGLALLAWQTKSNAAIVLPLAPIAWLFAILRGRWQWIAWAGVGLMMVALLGFSFTRDDAAFFYRSSSMEDAVRVMNEKAVLGEWVLQVDEQAPVTPYWMPAFFQPVPLEGVSRNLELPVTLGVWMWANRPVTAIAPKITTQGHEYIQTVQLSEEPVFYTVDARVDPGIARMWVSFDPLPNEGEDVVVYYDGLVLAEGIRPLDEPPVYADELATSGTWGGKPFENLLRNGSAEAAGLRLRTPIDELGVLFLPDHIRPSFVLASIFDREGAGWYYQIAMDRVLTTFWGYFGWSHIPLAYPWIYGLLSILGLVGIAGAIIALVRNWRSAPWRIVFFLALAVVMMAVATLMRGVIYLAYQNMFFPVARYLMPVVVPILLVLNTGWLEIWRLGQAGIWRILGKGQPVQQREISWIAYSIFTFLWIALDVAALVTVFQYYQGIPILR